MGSVSPQPAEEAALHAPPQHGDLPPASDIAPTTNALGCVVARTRPIGPMLARKIILSIPSQSANLPRRRRLHRQNSTPEHPSTGRPSQAYPRPVGRLVATALGRLPMESQLAWHAGPRGQSNGNDDPGHVVPMGGNILSANLRVPVCEGASP